MNFQIQQKNFLFSHLKNRHAKTSIVANTYKICNHLLHCSSNTHIHYLILFFLKFIPKILFLLAFSLFYHFPLILKFLCLMANKNFLSEFWLEYHCNQSFQKMHLNLKVCLIHPPSYKAIQTLFYFPLEKKTKHPS